MHCLFIGRACVSACRFGTWGFRMVCRRDRAMTAVRLEAVIIGGPGRLVVGRRRLGLRITRRRWRPIRLVRVREWVASCSYESKFNCSIRTSCPPECNTLDYAFQKQECIALKCIRQKLCHCALPVHGFLIQSPDGRNNNPSRISLQGVYSQTPIYLSRDGEFTRYTRPVSIGLVRYGSPRRYAAELNPFNEKMLACPVHRLD